MDGKIYVEGTFETHAELLQALEESGLLRLLIDNKYMHKRYPHWLRWWKMYQTELQGKGRYNGARNKVWGHFFTYYLEHPEEEMDISFAAVDKMVNHMKQEVRSKNPRIASLTNL